MAMFSAAYAFKLVLQTGHRNLSLVQNLLHTAMNNLKGAP